MEIRKSISIIFNVLILSVLLFNNVSAQIIDLDSFIPDIFGDIEDALDRHVEEFVQGDDEEDEGIDLELWGTEASDTEGVMQTVLEISQHMYRTEADLLFPVNTHVTVFFSITSGTKRQPQSVQISIDGKSAITHRYTKNELSAFKKAAVQRLYTGYVADGKHILKANVTVGGRRLSKSLSFTKGERPQFIELMLSGNKLQLKGWR